MGEAFVVLLRVHLHFPLSGSLKAKRAELNSLKAALRTKLGAAVAEVDHQDTWQRSTLAVAMTAGSAHRCEEAAAAACRLLDAHALRTIHLHSPGAGSLKAKRKDLASIKAQLHTRLGAAVSEVDPQDLWQRATLAAAVVGGSQGAVEQAADRVERFLDARLPQGVRVERTVAAFEELV